MSEDVDDVLGLGREMRRARQQGIHRGVGRVRFVQKPAAAKQRREPERAEAHARAVQELPARQEIVLHAGRVLRLVLVGGVHRLNITLNDGAGEPEVSGKWRMQVV